MARTTGKSVKLYMAAVPNTTPTTYSSLSSIITDSNEVKDAYGFAGGDDSPEPVDQRVVGQENARSDTLGSTINPRTFTVLYDPEDAVHKALETRASGTPMAAVIVIDPPGSAKGVALYSVTTHGAASVNVDEGGFTTMDVSLTVQSKSTLYET